MLTLHTGRSSQKMSLTPAHSSATSVALSPTEIPPATASPWLKDFWITLQFSCDGKRHQEMFILSSCSWQVWYTEEKNSICFTTRQAILTVLNQINKLCFLVTTFHLYFYMLLQPKVTETSMHTSAGEPDQAPRSSCISFSKMKVTAMFYCSLLKQSPIGTTFITT